MKPSLLIFLLVLFVQPAIGVCPNASSLLAEFAEQGKYTFVYDEVVELFSPHYELRKRHAKAMPRGKVNIVDAGGGTAIVTTHVMKDDPERVVEIFDNSKVMTSVAVVGKNLDPNKVHLSEVTRLIRNDGTPVPDGSIDGVMTTHVVYLLSLDGVKEFVAEARRVLRVGGILSIASMRTLDRELMAAMLRTAKQSSLRKEELGLLPVGSTEIAYSANVRLTTQAPTTFLNEEIIALVTEGGHFESLESEVLYDGGVFFVSFRKLN